MTAATLSPLFTWRSAIAKSDLPPTARHVALTLSLYMNEMGDSAWPSRETLAVASGLSVASIKRSIAVLTRAGYLRCEHRPGSSSLYAATTPDPPLFVGHSEPGSHRPGSHRPDSRVTVSPRSGHSDPRSSQEHVNTTPEGQRPSPSAAENGHQAFHLADVVNLNLVVSLKDRYRRRKPWDGVTEGLLTGLILGGKQGPGYGARAVNAAIDDLYENAAGVKNPSGYLRERAEAHSTPPGGRE